MDKLLQFGLCIVFLTSFSSSQVTFEADNLTPEAGGTVIMTCSVIGKTPLEFIKFYRKINGEVHEIGTNNYPRDVFRESKRYEIGFKAEGETSIFTFTITELEGRDSGEIGCELSRTPQSISQSLQLQVKVPPTSVTLYNYDPETQEEQPVSENGMIIMTQGKDDGFGCKADMQDYTGETPTVNIMLGEFEVSGLQSLDNGPTVRADQGWQKVDYTLEARKVTSEARQMNSGKTVVCQVKVGETVISTIPATARYMVEYEPKLNCDVSPKKVRKGALEFQLSCTGVMAPPPTPTGYGWKGMTEGGEPVNMTADAEAGQFLSDHQDLGNDKHQFTLRFGRVRPEDYHQYILHVTNKVGRAEATFTVEEQIDITLEPPVELTGKPVNPGPTYTHNGGDKVPGTNSASSSAFSITLLMLSIISVTFHGHL